MHLVRPAPARRRVRLAVAIGVCLAAIALPAAADSAAPPPPGPPPDVVAKAKASADSANAVAAAQDTALGTARQNLAAAQQQLAGLTAQIGELDATVRADQEAVGRLEQAAQRDRAALADYSKAVYARGTDGNLAYVMGAASIQDAMQREIALEHFASAGKALVSRVQSDEAQAKAKLEAAQRAKDRLAVVQAQAAATEQVLAAEEAQVQAADEAAHANLTATQNTLQGILSDSQAGSVPRSNVTYAPVASGGFTVDTDLTQPSGLNPNRINAFLDGTPMAGLGAAFIAAEQQHHVSARYFVAHAILESAWGSSRIAQDKHNLFGYGADDTNPYGDANSFPSFAACIDFVAGKVQHNYLTPGGPFFHGPTLRGMNVDYASDPHWAEKIARIANSIP